jgi:membrane protein implicated in regulation of membrane protease activity
MQSGASGKTKASAPSTKKRSAVSLISTPKTWKSAEKSMIGAVYPLESAIVNGAGSVRIGDSVWRVTGADLSAGTKVKVTGVDGSTLTVEPA